MQVSELYILAVQNTAIHMLNRANSNIKEIEIGKNGIVDVNKAQSEIMKSVQVAAATCTGVSGPLLKILA